MLGNGAIRGFYLSFIRRFRSRLTRRNVLPNGPYANGLLKVILVGKFVRRSNANVHARRRLGTQLSFLVIPTNRDLRRSARQPCRVMTSVQSTSSFSNYSTRRVEVIFTPRGATNILVGQIVSVCVSRVERNRRAKCVNVVRRSIITRSIRLRYVGQSVLKVNVSNVFLRDLFGLVNRASTLEERLLVVISFFRGLNYFPRKEGNGRVEQGRRKGDHYIV